jgi:acyl-CoA reductase-like NAD-dependent aldehyde dehydrogenase
MHEEPLAPIASASPVAVENEALNRASQSTIGRQMYLWTGGHDSGGLIARPIHGGCIFASQWVKSALSTPFGGGNGLDDGRGPSEAGLRGHENRTSELVE